MQIISLPLWWGSDSWYFFEQTQIYLIQEKGFVTFNFWSKNKNVFSFAVFFSNPEGF